MNYIEFKEALKSYTVFSVGEIKKINNNFHRRRLNNWQDKGYLKKVIKGYYIFAELNLSEPVLFEIANKIHRPSYISLEMALSYYHLIPESIYTITSISSRRSGKYETQLANFGYRKLKPELYFGYQLIENNHKIFKIASIEKAILDYFYLNSYLNTPSDFASLRINVVSLLEQIDENKFYSYLEKFAQNRLNKRIKMFMDFVKNA